jgi:hypothetical protein
MRVFIFVIFPNDLALLAVIRKRRRKLERFRVGLPFLGVNDVSVTR